MGSEGDDEAQSCGSHYSRDEESCVMEVEIATNMRQSDLMRPAEGRGGGNNSLSCCALHHLLHLLFLPHLRHHLSHDPYVRYK